MNAKENDVSDGASEVVKQSCTHHNGQTDKTDISAEGQLLL